MHTLYFKVLSVGESFYPERMKRLLFIRAPRIFPGVWALMKRFLPESTRSKVLLLEGDDDLLRVVPASSLPKL